VKLLLVRHGESTWNAEGRYQGRHDAPLSERGLMQAQALAEHLAGSAQSRPNAIVSSPLARARDTARIAAERLGLRADVDESLVEISHGEWEGLLKSEIALRWPEMFAAWRSAPDSVRFPGGESLDDVRRRWRTFLSGAARNSSPLLIVTHDVIVRLAVLDARDQSLRDFNSFAAENAALTEIDYTPAGLQLIFLNERSYLGAHRVDPTAQAL
jgi:broad specificity phosphatase PhoE